MRIAVLGAGSWGTTVASLLAGHNDCTVWARDPELAREIYERDANSRYLPGFALPSSLKATADLEKAVHDIDLLVVAPKWQARGVGAMLLEHVHGVARSYGIDTVELDVYQFNAAGLRLYEKMGYATTLRRMKLRLDRV